MDDCQCPTVVAVGVSTHGMFQHMALEVGLLAQLQQAVFGKGGVPHQFATGKVIVRVGNQGTQILDDIAHHRLVDFIGKVVGLRLAHIGLHTMAQCVECSADYLSHRECLGKVAIQDGKAVICSDQRLLQLLFGVGDDCPVVLLRTCSRCRNDSTHRYKFVGIPMLRVLHLPDVLV